MTSHALEPLPYHRAVVRHLREKEPEVWAWASSVRVQQEHAELLRKELLRNTYRLTGQSHPQVQQAAELAAQRLGLSLPVTLYQGADGPMNATLIFLPGEAHVMFTGPMLERFSHAELLAVLGHELSHYVLWTVEEGTFHAADRILVQAAADPGAQGCQRETARLYSLYTEIFADRGGVLAAKDAAPVISTLVKTQTGLSSVDAAAYLEQGREIDLLEPARSEALSHPESYLRAQAMDRWWRQEGEVDEWLRRRIEGELSMERLDLPGQEQLRGLCRGFIARLLQEGKLASAPARTQARAYFPDWSDGEAPLELAQLQGEAIADSVRDFLCAVLLDFALVDPDVREDALPDAGRIAMAMGAEKQLLAGLRKHLGMNKRALDKLARQWAREAAA